MLKCQIACFLKKKCKIAWNQTLQKPDFVHTYKSYAKWKFEFKLTIFSLPIWIQMLNIKINPFCSGTLVM